MSETAPSRERGGRERLLAHLAAVERLTRDRTPAAERLRRELGAELAATLVFALATRGGRRDVDVAA
jgi:hypothetical protein